MNSGKHYFSSFRTTITMLVVLNSWIWDIYKISNMENKQIPWENSNMDTDCIILIIMKKIIEIKSWWKNSWYWHWVSCLLVIKLHNTLLWEPFINDHDKCNHVKFVWNIWLVKITSCQSLQGHCLPQLMLLLPQIPPVCDSYSFCLMLSKNL